MTDEPLYRDRVCGNDIGKAGLVATIRVPSEKNPARRAAETRSFGTTKRLGWKPEPSRRPQARDGLDRRSGLAGECGGDTLGGKIVIKRP